jgi:hypothetical protein
MSMQSISILTLSLIAAGAIAKHRFVTHAKAQAGAAANTLGVAKHDAVLNDGLTVDVIGTAIVEAGAAIADGAEIETDASGRAITKAAGVTTARALQAAAAAGDFIEVLLIQN